MTTSNCSYLDDDADNEDCRGHQNAVLSRGGLSNETRHDGSKPGTEFQDGSEPSLLCCVVDVAIGLCSVSAQVDSQGDDNIRFPNEGI